MPESQRTIPGGAHIRRAVAGQLDVSIQFTDEACAIAFERYVKSGSGCEFSKRHFR